MEKLSRSFAVLCACVCLPWPAPAVCRADDPAPAAQAQDSKDDAVTAAARELAVEGVKLAQNERCAEAVDKLERAERLHHAPIVLTRLGECYIKLGRLVEGRERLRAVMREPLPAAPSAALQQAYADAQSALDTTETEVAHLIVRAEGVPEGTRVVLSIDERTLPSELVGVSQPADPGAHVIQVKADGYLPSSRRVTLEAGHEQSVVLTLTAAPRSAETRNAKRGDAPAREPSAPALSWQTKPAADSGGASHAPAYISWGVGAAALGVGIGFGIAAMNEKADLDTRCPDKVCPASSRELLDSSRTNALISTIGYATAGAGAALGLVLFLMESSSDSKATQKAQRISPTADGVRVTF